MLRDYQWWEAATSSRTGQIKGRIRVTGVEQGLAGWSCSFKDGVFEQREPRKRDFTFLPSSDS